MSKSSSADTKTKSPTTRKIVRFRMLLKELKLEHQKEAILSPYGVVSTKLLSIEQLDECIAALEQKQATHKKDTPYHIRRLRSRILDLLVQIGIENNGDKQQYWERVNKYLSNPRIAGKLLYEMNEEELKKCVNKLHMVRKETERRIQDEQFWATHN